ncbi:MAG: hypothetical protein IAF08_00355 [Rhizobacter sp.]|nr:hypothetical protein [Chlorobiales bacterium]
MPRKTIAGLLLLLSGGFNIYTHYGATNPVSITVMLLGAACVIVGGLVLFKKW